MEVEFALSKIDNLYVEFFKRDFKDFTKIKRIDFEYRSYARWALDEIRQYLIRNKDKDLFENLELFKYQMDVFACNGKCETSFIFSVAYDITQFVIEELNTYYIYERKGD